MKLATKSLLSVVLATGLAAGAAVASEQNTTPSDASAGQPQQSEVFTVSAQQVADFVDAYVAIKDIGQHYRTKIRSVGDKAKVPELQKQARGEMKNAIIASGLGLSEYKQIVLAANYDRALRNRISAAINKASEPQQTAQTGR